MNTKGVKDYNEFEDMCKESFFFFLISDMCKESKKEITEIELG
jgi:hypothetical protein